MKKHIICVTIISVIAALSAIPAFSQDPQAPAKDESASTQAAQAAAPQTPSAETAVKTNELSIYGEVQAVNVQTASMSVQYYDYDNDEEKTLEVYIDKDSKLENVKSIDEVKKGDWVDVMYVADGGKNMAKMVSVEKEDQAAENNAPVDTAEE